MVFTKCIEEYMHGCTYRSICTPLTVNKIAQCAFEPRHVIERSPSTCAPRYICLHSPQFCYLNKFIYEFSVFDRYIQLWANTLPYINVMSIYGQEVWQLYPIHGMIKSNRRPIEDLVHSNEYLPVDSMI